MVVKLKVLILSLISLVGCSSMEVNYLPSNYDFNFICVESNPKSKVDGFEDVVRDRLAFHGIETEVFNSIPSTCQYRLTYLALPVGLILPDLLLGEVVIYEGEKEIARGEYHRVFTESVNPITRLKTDADKMNPIIDEMLGKTSKG